MGYDVPAKCEWTERTDEQRVRHWPNFTHNICWHLKSLTNTKCFNMQNMDKIQPYENSSWFSTRIQLSTKELLLIKQNHMKSSSSEHINCSAIQTQSSSSLITLQEGLFDQRSGCGWQRGSNNNVISQWHRWNRLTAVSTVDLDIWHTLFKWHDYFQPNFKSSTNMPFQQYESHKTAFNTFHWKRLAILK